MPEAGPLVYSPYPRRLECLTICRYNYKGSIFSSVMHLSMLSRWGGGGGGGWGERPGKGGGFGVTSLPVVGTLDHLPSPGGQNFWLQLLVDWALQTPWISAILDDWEWLETNTAVLKIPRSRKQTRQTEPRAKSALFVILKIMEVSHLAWDVLQEKKYCLFCILVHIFYIYVWILMSFLLTSLICSLKVVCMETNFPSLHNARLLLT